MVCCSDDLLICLYPEDPPKEFIMKFALLFAAVVCAYTPPFSEEDIYPITCSDGIEPRLLKDTKKVYFCTDNDHMIFHSSALDTRPNNTHNPFNREDPIPHWDKKWIEIETNDYTMIADGGIPYTTCLSFEDGYSGTVAASLADGLSGSFAFDFGFALISAVVFGANTNVNVRSGLLYSLSAEYGCAAESGQTVQLMVVPSFYRFREGKYRILYLGGRMKPKVIYDDWQDIPDTQTVGYSQLLKCVTDPQLMRCDSVMANPWFLDKGTSEEM